VSEYMASPRFVVQFPHPGGEHNPGNQQRQPWNTGNHRRKFLQSYGRYLDKDGSLSEGDLVFWGEWEAPSYVIKRWEQKDSLPRFLHLPVWECPATTTMRQNTDPWVFGDSFRFSNCQQLTPKRNRSFLQSLTLGSLILFGSTIGADFVIDTVFVIKDGHRFSPGEPPESDEAFGICTVESLLTSGNPNDPLTLYRGATYEAAVDGMYSFVPCRPAHVDEVRFPRPAISLGPYVNPKSTQSARCSKARSHADVREQWNRIRKQVLDAGCLLAVWVSTPQLERPEGVGKRH
jgi:hypothetical protein